jgi:hypothetical protein
MHFHDNRYTYCWVRCSVYGPPGGCKSGVFLELGVVGQSHVEAESNTSTVTLRVVGGREKEVSNLRQ